jgi:hypothetical protein
MRVVFGLEPRWAPMLGLNSRGLFTTEHEGGWPKTNVQNVREEQ